MEQLDRRRETSFTLIVPYTSVEDAARIPSPAVIKLRIDKQEPSRLDPETDMFPDMEPPATTDRSKEVWVLEVTDRLPPRLIEAPAESDWDAIVDSTDKLPVNSAEPVTDRASPPE